MKKGFIVMFSALVCIGGVVQAQDGWQQLGNLSAGYIYSLTINSSGNIFAGGFGDGVFRSSDGGNSWIPINSGLVNKRVQTIVIDQASGYLFVGTDSGGVFRSTDNGSNWTNVGLVGKSVHAIAIKPNGPIFASVGYPGIDSGAVFRSTDQGSSWSIMTSGVTITAIRTLAIDSAGNVYAGTGGDGVFRSTDNGASWTHLDLKGFSITALLVAPNGDVYAGTYLEGVYRSTDNGLTWQYHSMNGKSGRSLAVNVGGVVFAGTYNDGVYRTFHEGECWSNAGLAGMTVRSLVFDANGYLYAGTDVGVYRTVITTTSTFQIDRCQIRFASTLIPYSVSDTFMVRNLSASPVTFSSITITDTAYHLSPTTATIPAGDSSAFIVTFAPKVANAHPAVLAMTSLSTNFPEELALNGWARTRILAHPETLTVITDLGSSKDTTFSMENAGNDTIGITGMNLSDAALTLQPTTDTLPPVATPRTYTLSFKPVVPGLTAATLVIISDAPASPESIFVWGWARTRILRIQADSIGPAKDSVAFGNVTIEAFKDTAIVFFNDGNDPVRVSNITSADNLFSARPKNFVIPPGGSVIDTLRFNPVAAGNISGRLRVISDAFVPTLTIVVTGNGTTPEGVRNRGALPDKYALYQNYPNPFNPTTDVRFDLPAAGFVSLKVFDLLGRDVATLVDEAMEPGEYSVRWIADGVPSGVYFYRLQAGQFVDIKKLTLMR